MGVERKFQLKHLFDYYYSWASMWRPKLKPKPGKERKKALKKKEKRDSFKFEDKAE